MRHNCRANADAEADAEDDVNDVANNNDNNNAGMEQEEMLDGDVANEVGAAIGQEEAVHGVGNMKQPALEHLDPVALCQFDAVVVKLLRLAVNDAGLENNALGERALIALRNLPGCLKHVQYRASGKASNRKKAMNVVLSSLIRAGSERMIEAIEELEQAMAVRLKRYHTQRKQVGVEQEWDGIVEKTSKMVREGNLGAALSLVMDWEEGLRGQEVHRTAAEVKALLEPKFPQGTEADHVMSYAERCADLPDGAEPPPPLELQEEAVLASMQSLLRGKAAGQSGWTNSLLKDMALNEKRSEELIPLITRWFNMTLAGHGGPAAMWTMGRVGLLDKADGTLRAIVVGETLIRFMTRTVAFVVRQRAREVLAPHQFSVGVAGGIEQITQAFALFDRRVKASAGERAIVATDVANAFPSMRRGPIADAVWEEFPELYPAFEWLYGESSDLVLASGEVVARIESGIRAGCGAGTLLFDLGLNPVLKRVAAAEPEVTVQFYSDDGNLEGEPANVKRATVRLVEEMADIGLSCHFGKSLYYDGQLVEGEANESMGEFNGEEILFRRTEGAKIVGRAVGLDAYVQAQLERTLAKQARGMDRIAQLQPDVALILLTYCVNTRPMFLARNFDSETIQQHLSLFDEAVDKCVACICQCTNGEATWWMKELRGLPVDLGGLGLPRLSTICTAAHVACLIEALVGLKGTFTEAVFAEVRACVSQAEVKMVSHFLPFLVEDHVLRLPGEPSVLAQEGMPVDAHVAYQKEMAMVKQSALCKKLYKTKHEETHARLLLEGDHTRAAMVLSTQRQKKMSRWIKGGLYGNLHNRLATGDFLQALRLRLLVPEYQGVAWVCGCVAGVLVREDFNHLLHCKAATMAIAARHNKVRATLAEFCRFCVGADGQVEEEVVLGRRGELSACRIDIIVTTALGETYYVDTTVVNPGAKAYVHGADLGLVGRRLGSSYVPGHAVEVKGAWKQQVHLQRLSPAQMAGFAPFAVETSGRLGQAAVAFLQKMEQCHNARLGDAAAGAMRKRRAWFLIELGMAVTRGTAKVLSMARAKIRLRRDAAQVDGEGLFFDDEEGPPDDYQPAYAAGGVGQGENHGGDYQLAHAAGGVDQEGDAGENHDYQLAQAAGGVDHGDDYQLAYAAGGVDHGQGNEAFDQLDGDDEQVGVVVDIFNNQGVDVDDEAGGPEA
jgi:hypothetical protein